MSRSIGEKSKASARDVAELVDGEIKSLEMELKVKGKHELWHSTEMKMGGGEWGESSEEACSRAVERQQVVDD
jgi:hypothetical protein